MGRLGEIQVPTLVVLGGLDVPDMLAIGAHLGHEVPDVQVATLAGVAHLPSMEQPETFDAIAAPFPDAHLA